MNGYGIVGTDVIDGREPICGHATKQIGCRNCYPADAKWPFGEPRDTIEIKPEAVDHPKHYNAHPSGVECITVVEHMPFNVGNAVKYLWRAGEKPGVDAVEDLRKAAWYVAREIERRSKP